MEPRIILNNQQVQLIINRLCWQLIENHNDFSDTVIIGLQPRGIYLSQRLHARLTELTGSEEILHGNLDITFYRDDFRRRSVPLVPQNTRMDFLVENKNVILIDDVLFTGRTVRAGLDALLSYGRPKAVELLVLIDRRFSRHLPIGPDYVGRTVDAIASERVKVDWADTEGRDQVWLYTLNRQQENE